MVRLFIVMLWWWSIGGLLFALIALSDLLFTRNFKALPRRLVFCLIWPIALFSSKGRAALISVARQTQE